MDDFSFLLECPLCDASFWPMNNMLMRAGHIPQEDCPKCLDIQKFVEGLE
jgi:hypothetical protein